MAKSLDKSKLQQIKRRAAAPVVQRMKAAAPSDRLASAVGMTTAKSKTGGGTMSMRIGVIKNPGGGTMSAPALASIFEYGSADRVQASTGRRTGSVTKRPWLRPAWDGTVNQLKATFEQGVISAVESGK